MADAEDRQGPPLAAIPLLIFAALDIAAALLLLAAEGFSLGFLVVVAIGLGLAAVGMWSVFSQAALDHARKNPERKPLPRVLQPRRRRPPRP